MKIKRFRLDGLWSVAARTIYAFLFGIPIATSSGCIILPFPGKQVPVADMSDANLDLDPRTLIGKDGPIHPGTPRDRVHAVIGLPEDFVGPEEQHEPVEEYHFRMRAGCFFWLAPNPEGGIIGINKRYMTYTLKIFYGPQDIVSSCRLTSQEVLDSHEGIDGKYE